MRGIALLAVVAIAPTIRGDGRQPAGEAVQIPMLLQVRQVLVVARDNRFQPNAIRVARGTTIRFIIKNLDPDDHDFALVPEGPPPC